MSVLKAEILLDPCRPLDRRAVFTWVVKTYTRAAVRYAEAVSYEVFTCSVNHKPSSPGVTDTWEKLAEYKAEPEMRCTLFGLLPDCTYYVLLRAIDVHDRRGPFEMIQFRT